jgi:hypothetical protein
MIAAEDHERAPFPVVRDTVFQRLAPEIIIEFASRQSQPLLDAYCAPKRRELIRRQRIPMQHGLADTMRFGDRHDRISG